MKNNSKEKQKIPNYAVQIGEHLFKRIDEHVQLLKYLKHKNTNKKSWLIDAIKEKIEKEKNIPIENLPKDKHLNLAIETELREVIEQQISQLKQVRRSYSKKQWIVEAVSEKLSQEEDSVRKQVKEKMGS